MEDPDIALKLKKESIIKNAQSCKEIVKKWDAAFWKTEGRKPGEDDMRNAPETVQQAHKDYYRAAKLLKRLSSTSQLRGDRKRKRSGNGKVDSPRKIFFGRDSTSGNCRWGKGTGMIHSGKGHENDIFSSGVNYSVINQRLDLVMSRLELEKIPPKKKVDARESVWDSEEKLETQEDVGLDRNVILDRVNSKFLDEADDVKASSNIKGNKHLRDLITQANVNSVSTIWQNLSPKGKLNGNKRVDTAWLDRCKNVTAEEGLEEKEIQSNKDLFDVSIDLSSMEFSMNDADDEDSNEIENEPLFSENFQNLLMTTAQSTHSIEVEAAPVALDTAFVPSIDPKQTLPQARATRSARAAQKTSSVQQELDRQLTSFVNDEDCDSSKPRKKRKLNNGGSLAIRIKKGKLNENFVKIDITKKVFVRGHKKKSGAKAKRNDWKFKKAAASREERLNNIACRKCGETGHFAKFCTQGAEAEDVTSVEPQQIDESPFPSLEEAAMMANNKAVSNSTRFNFYPAAIVNCLKPDESSPNILLNTVQTTSINSYFRANENYSQAQENNLLLDTIHKFGYESFRPGQKEVCSRILKGLSTLCILSTGSGKSICYQLPAYLYAKKYPGALALCVSPLVSLMEDQVEGIPSFLQAAFLHSNMPQGLRDKVLAKVKSKKLHILIVSPEAVCGGLFGLIKGNDLPQISFACIDEVHCVSQWSHNFRPSYLQLSKILREKLGVTTVLGLTATATEYTANGICSVLHIDPATTIRGEIIPKNLYLSASRDVNREEALLTLLRGKRFESCDSIIVYCTRREECTRIAAILRTNLRDTWSDVKKTNLKQRVSNTCEAYHAGMTAGKRRLVQQQFMSGNIRIVVATVAFGMGIDKSNIRAVIHYNMPKTFEAYVQEIGRAGRDGLPAHCHLFLDNVKGQDLCELKRHVYCNSIDKATLRKLVRKVFQPCKCARIAEMSSRMRNNHDTQHVSDKKCPGHEISFIIEEAVQDLDLPQENITTLLCYLELDPNRKWIEMLPHTYQTCKIQSYAGAGLLKSAAHKCPPLAAAIALKKEKKQFNDTDAHLQFNVIEVSATLGWNSGTVKTELKNLQWLGSKYDPTTGKAEILRRSALLVEFCDLAYHAKAPGDLSDQEYDFVLDYLFQHNQEQEKTQLYQLIRVHQALLSISHNTVDTLCDKPDDEKSNCLKMFIHEYFLQQSSGVPEKWKHEDEVRQSEDEEGNIRRSIRDLLASVPDTKFTGRSIAKIFQGISSPCFPSDEWYRNRAFWRKYIHCDYHFLCKIASQEILRF